MRLVSADTPAAQVIERGHLPREVVGIVEGRRRGKDEADPFGRERAGRGEDHRIVHTRRHIRRIGEGWRVGLKHCVKQRLFRRARYGLEMRNVLAGSPRSLLSPPRCGVPWIGGLNIEVEVALAVGHGLGSILGP
jgi:hypothetical protein